MTPIEVACRHQNADLTNCGAESNEACVWEGWNFAQPHPDFHAERIEDAAGIGTAEGLPVSEKQFDDAVAKEVFE